jgi:adenylate cyclase
LPKIGRLAGPRPGTLFARDLIMQGAASVVLPPSESGPEPEASATVEIFESGGGWSAAVPRQGLRVGRAHDQDVVLSAPTISKHHALLYWQGEDLFVRDFDSRNGTRRDGISLREPTRLRDDDELVLGGAVVVRIHLREVGFGAPLSELIGEAPLAPVPKAEASSLDVDLLPLVTSLYRAASHEELAFQLARRAGSLLGASRAAVLEIEDDERYRTLGLCKTSRLDERPLHDARFVSRTVLERARRDGASLFSESAGQTNESLVRSGAHAALAARIPSRDHRERILYLDCTLSEPPFTQAHRRAVELIAAHAAGAFESLEAQLAGGRERMRFEQLRRYFSPAVVEHILDRGGEAVDQPHNLEATVLFADLVGYTKLSERLKDEPARLLSVLNSWLDVGAQIVVRRGGTLDKFIGDCVMAVFGAPFPMDRAELVAVECALEMREAIAQISFEENLPLAITVGINSGELLAGSVGSRRRLEYTVLGDTVNVASRLQSQATPGEILVGPLTAERVAEAIFTEDAGIRSLKNHGPVQAHRVLGSMHGARRRGD